MAKLVLDKRGKLQTYVALSKNLSKLDVGGLLGTLWHFINDTKNIRQIEEEFINQSLDAQLDAELRELDKKIIFFKKRLNRCV
jgi:hypothetical protein